MVSAADDFVKDYREIAGMPLWDNLFEKHPEGKKQLPQSFRALDTCCGTGRWAQAFSELVLQPRKLTATCDFFDLCEDSLGVIRNRLPGFSNIDAGEVIPGDLSKLGAAGVPASTYDLVVNMHGLYGVPKILLPPALQGMHDSLVPGGIMVIALGMKASPYQQIPMQIGVPSTDSDDVIEALDRLGLQFTVTDLVYHEAYEASDKEGVLRFLMDECGGNIFPVDKVDQAMDIDQSLAAIKPYADSHFDTASAEYKFKQDIAVITVQKEDGPKKLNFF
jgi:SAM-dependent methyltransferase